VITAPIHRRRSSRSGTVVKVAVAKASAAILDRAQAVIGIWNPQLIQRMMRLFQIFSVGKPKFTALERRLVGYRRPRRLVISFVGKGPSHQKHVPVCKGVSKSCQKTSALRRVGKVRHPTGSVKAHSRVLMIKALASGWNMVLELDDSVGGAVVLEPWTRSVAVKLDFHRSGRGVSVTGGFDGERRVRHLRFSVGHYVVHLLQRAALGHDSVVVRDQAF